MSAWLWVNLASGAPFVAAIVGVPLWLVITRPGTGPAPRLNAAPRRIQAAARGSRPTPSPAAATRPASSARPRARPVWPDLS